MKIKIGKSRITTAQAKLGFDVNTTAQFGHCQPVMCKEMCPDSKFTVEMDTFVRTSPLVSPTFGRIKHKVWNTFVPLADIWQPFENMLAQQTFEGYGENYLPTEVPTITIGDLSKCVYNLDLSMGCYSGATLTNPEYLKSIHLETLNLVPLASANVYTQLRNTLGQNMPWYIKNIWGNYSTNTGHTSIYNVSSTTDSNKSAQFVPVSGITESDFPSGTYGTPSSFDQLWVYPLPSNQDQQIYYFQKLSDRQKRLRKVLLGLGYQLDATNGVRVSILPLIAYYKAWFDTLVPQRNEVTWTDTSAFHLIKYLWDNNYTDVSAKLRANTNQDGPFVTSMLIDFLIDLAETFYYDDADFYTAHIKKTADYTGSVTVPYLDYDGTDPSVGSPLAATNDLQPSLYNAQTLSAVQLKLITLLTKFVNKNTAIGGRIAEYLRVHYGAEVENALIKSNFIGGDSTDIQVTDVMSNAETEDATLGQYAGKAVGYKDGANFSFKAKTFGYWISFSCIVPKSRFFQGVDPNLTHSTRFQYFTPEFDALGFQDTPCGLFMNNEGFYSPLYDETTDAGGTLAHFGFIPRYSEYKTSIKNTVNGDMSLPSLRDGMAQYNLDKMITPVNVTFKDMENHSGDTYENFTVNRAKVNNYVVDPYLRRIGYDPSLGNFDRIFYLSPSDKMPTAIGPTIDMTVDNAASRAKFILNYLGINDNFIIHNIINVSATLPMIPISESFDTDGNEGDAVEVDKA